METKTKARYAVDLTITGEHDTDRSAVATWIEAAMERAGGVDVDVTVYDAAHAKLLESGEQFETTNEVLARVRTDLEQLLEWADADAQASNEAGAKEQRRADVWRGNQYSQALMRLKDTDKAV